MRLLLALVFITSKVWAIPERAIEIHGGHYHYCALTESRELWCWGENLSGSLGLGTTQRIYTKPQKVPLPNTPKIQSIQLGSYHTCALFENGRAKCWGNNTSGRLGLGTTSYSIGDSPSELIEFLPYIDLGKEEKIVKLAIGDFHNCAIFSDGSVKCWGNNLNGKLGLGDTRDRGRLPSDMGINLPSVDVPAKIIDGCAGGDHTCMLSEKGEVFCWGNYLLLGAANGSEVHVGVKPNQMGHHLKSLDLGSGVSAKKLTCAFNHTCALLSDGHIKCWGYNGAGKLGQGNALYSSGHAIGSMGDALPRVNFGSGIRVRDMTSGGGSHNCAVLENGTTKCWGSNHYGQLGVGDSKTRGYRIFHMGTNLPFAKLKAFEWVVQAAVSTHSTVVLLSDGTLKSWGHNQKGQLGTGSSQLIWGTQIEHMLNTPTIELGSDGSHTTLKSRPTENH